MSGFIPKIDIADLKYCNPPDDVENCLDYDTVKRLLNTINQLINTFNIDTKNIIQDIDNYHKDVVTNKELFDLKSKIDQKYNNIIILNDLITLKKKFEEKLEEKIPTSSYPKKTREDLEKLKKDVTELNIKDDEYKELDSLYNDLIKDFEKYDNTYDFEKKDKMYFQTIETKLGNYESKLNDIKYCNIEFGGKKGRKTNKRTTKKMKKSKKVKSKTKKMKKMKKINRNKQSKKIKTGSGPGCSKPEIPEASYVDNIKTAEAREVNSRALKKLRDLGLLKPTTATYVENITVAVDSIVLEQ